MIVLALSPNGTTAVLGGRTPYGAPYLGDELSLNLTSPVLVVEVRRVVSTVSIRTSSALHCSCSLRPTPLYIDYLPID